MEIRMPLHQSRKRTTQQLLQTTTPRHIRNGTAPSLEQLPVPDRDSSRPRSICFVSDDSCSWTIHPRRRYRPRHLPTPSKVQGTSRWVPRPSMPPGPVRQLRQPRVPVIPSWNAFHYCHQWPKLPERRAGSDHCFGATLPRPIFGSHTPPCSSRCIRVRRISSRALPRCLRLLRRYQWLRIERQLVLLDKSTTMMVVLATHRFLCRGQYDMP